MSEQDLFVSGIYFYDNSPIASWNFGHLTTTSHKGFSTKTASFLCHDKDNMIEVIPDQIQAFSDSLSGMMWEGTRFIVAERVRGEQTLIRKATVMDILMKLADPHFGVRYAKGEVYRADETPGVFEFFPFEITVEKPEYIQDKGYVSSIGICHIADRFQNAARGVKTVGYLPKDFDVFFVRLAYRIESRLDPSNGASHALLRDCAIICPKNDPIADAQVLDRWLMAQEGIALTTTTMTPKKALEICDAAKVYALQFGFANDSDLLRHIRKFDYANVLGRCADLKKDISKERVRFAFAYGVEGLSPSSKIMYDWKKRIMVENVNY